MPAPDTIYMLLNAIASANFGFLGFVLWTKSFTDNKLANRWMACCLWFIGLLPLDDALLESGLYLHFPHLLLLPEIPLMAIAPCCYWSVYNFVYPGRPKNPYLWMHFVPAGLYVLVILFPALLLGGAEKKAMVTETMKTQYSMDFGEILFFVIIFVQCSLYLGAGIVRLRVYQMQLRRISSNIQKTGLVWLHWFLLGIVLMLVLWMLEIAFVQSNSFTYAANLGYSVCCYLLGYFAIRQQEVFPFPQKDLTAIAAILETPPVSAHHISTIDHSQKAMLEDFMAKKQPYLDPELSLPGLASLFDCSTHELSHLINEGFGVNFYRFINSYRVTASKQLLTNPAFAHYSVLAIGFEAGFNSKTTFNTTFKSLTGLSPLAYRQQYTSNNEVVHPPQNTHSIP